MKLQTYTGNNEFFVFFAPLPYSPNYKINAIIAYTGPKIICIRYYSV